MKDKDLNKIVDLAYVGGGWLPANDLAKEISELSGRGQVHSFIECTARDLKFHRCYMSLISFIYDYLPERFKKRVKKQAFYQWLKHLQGKYKILYTFADGTTFIEYESIAFGKMSQLRFKEYVKEQLPFIYTEVIGKFFDGEIYDNIIDTIEEEYKKFMVKLDY
jgi:hypothetical protein